MHIIKNVRDAIPDAVRPIAYGLTTSFFILSAARAIGQSGGGVQALMQLAEGAGLAESGRRFIVNARNSKETGVWGTAKRVGGFALGAGLCALGAVHIKDGVTSMIQSKQPSQVSNGSPSPETRIPKKVLGKPQGFEDVTQSTDDRPVFNTRASSYPKRTFNPKPDYFVPGGAKEGFGRGGRDGLHCGQQVLSKFQQDPGMPRSILFDEARLDPFLTGGICSAQSSQFARDSMEKCHSLKHEGDWIACMYEFAKKYGFGDSSARSIQAALNAHIVNPQLTNDPKGDQVRMIARSAGLAVVDAIPQDFYSGSSYYLKECLQQLKPNVPYLVRTFCLPREGRPDDIARLEGYGHTQYVGRMIFEGGQTCCYFFDPNQGFGIWKDPSRWAQAIDTSLEWDKDNWNLGFSRFYELGAGEPILTRQGA